MYINVNQTNFETRGQMGDCNTNTILKYFEECEPIIISDILAQQYTQEQKDYEVRVHLIALFMDKPSHQKDIAAWPSVMAAINNEEPIANIIKVIVNGLRKIAGPIFADIAEKYQCDEIIGLTYAQYLSDHNILLGKSEKLAKEGFEQNKPMFIDQKKNQLLNGIVSLAQILMYKEEARKTR